MNNTYKFSYFMEEINKSKLKKDFLLEMINYFACKGKYANVDALLNEITILNNRSYVSSIRILLLTLPIKARLKKRKAFIERIKTYMEINFPRTIKKKLNLLGKLS